MTVEPANTVELPLPTSDDDALDWVVEHLNGLYSGPPTRSPAFTGGQSAADTALANLDIGFYARSRSTVHPPSKRGASKLSPYIRHGLLPLAQVWDASTNTGSGQDRFRYQSELLWQEYARHWYAVFGTATRSPVAFEPAVAAEPWPLDPWPTEMACIDRTVAELETDGWAVNQTRMWLAGQYTVRGHGDPADGENRMFRHLLDGSRAANRLGWQWTVGTSRSRSYGFTRRQVKKRAASYCTSCSLQDTCPIVSFPTVEPRSKVDPPVLLDRSTAFGPTSEPSRPRSGDGKESGDGVEPEVVWITAESLGDADPALAAHPDLPVVFTFDEALLRRLQLSAKRLVFLTECLADLGRRRDLRLHLGNPLDPIADRPTAVTFAPVPGFRRYAAHRSTADNLVVHPWAWLRPCTDALADHLATKGRFPSFRDWCRLTKPARPAPRS